MYAYVSTGLFLFYFFSYYLRAPISGVPYFPHPRLHGNGGALLRVLNSVLIDHPEQNTDGGIYENEIDVYFARRNELQGTV